MNYLENSGWYDMKMQEEEEGKQARRMAEVETGSGSLSLERMHISGDVEMEEGTADDYQMEDAL